MNGELLLELIFVLQFVLSNSIGDVFVLTIGDNHCEMCLIEDALVYMPLSRDAALYVSKYSLLFGLSVEAASLSEYYYLRLVFYSFGVFPYTSE